MTALSGHVLSIQRSLASPIEDVFNALTDPVAVGRWFGPPDSTVVHCDLNPRTGGKWCIRLRLGNGQHREVHGHYVHLLAPHSLSYTWQWRDENSGADGPQTLVSIQLVSTTVGTTLELQQAEFADADVLDQHRLGWLASLMQLERELE